MRSKVIVAGSINMDLVATAAALPRPGETLIGQRFERFPGGKGANQAIAAAKLGAWTTMIGCAGNDAFAQELQANLKGNGVCVQVTAVQAPTGIAMIVVDASGENSIVVVPGANAMLDAGAVLACEARPGDVLVSQLEVPLPAVRSFLEHGRAAGALTMLNAAPASIDAAPLLYLADILVVNETELELFSDRNTACGDQMVHAALACRRFPEQIVVATRGGEGSIAIHGDEVLRHSGHEVEVVDTTGAGDCFVGSLAASLAAGAALGDALARANRAASICVQRSGAGPSMPTAAELARSSGHGPGTPPPGGYRP